MPGRYIQISAAIQSSNAIVAMKKKSVYARSLVVMIYYLKNKTTLFNTFFGFLTIKTEGSSSRGLIIINGVMHGLCSN